MKAMVLRNPKPIEDEPLLLEEVSKPHPSEKEILIRVRACGVCRTDLHIAEGELPDSKLPLILGHQIVGEVVEQGSKVTKFNTGDKVGVPWLYSACRKCTYCANGLENLCEKAQFTGYHVDGGYAEYAIAREDFTYSIPNDFSFHESAPLLCAGVIGYRALKLSGVREGHNLGIYGFGSSAHITIQVARHLGCCVFVFTRSPEHKKLAIQLGAEWVGRASDIPPQKMDGSIIFAPAGWMVPEALKTLNKGGTLVTAGIYMSPIPRMDYNLIYGERSIQSVANMTRKDAVELLKLAGDIPIRTEVSTFSLAEANKVLRLLKESKIKGTAVLSLE